MKNFNQVEFNRSVGFKKKTKQKKKTGSTYN